MEIPDLLVLQSIKGIGNKSQLEIIKAIKSKGLKSFIELDLTELAQFKLQKRTVKALSDFSDTDYNQLLEECHKKITEWQRVGISAVSFGCNSYPDKLKELEEPPALLFCKGNLDLLQHPRSIAVVGTRQNTRLGEVITRKTVEHFTRSGFCIVSGLALGIDAIAHRVALANDGATIAVVVDVENVSPSNHRSLAQEILNNNGLLVSENPPNTKVIPAFFAKRDRIQAGLSSAVFAIETSIDGGTMHAVKSAISLGRYVFVPNAEAAGYKDLSENVISGTQMLIRDGLAKPYTRDTYKIITDALTGDSNKCPGEHVRGGAIP